jgi:hypothetical protein
MAYVSHPTNKRFKLSKEAKEKLSANLKEIREKFPRGSEVDTQPACILDPEKSKPVPKWW